VTSKCTVERVRALVSKFLYPGTRTYCTRAELVRHDDKSASPLCMILSGACRAGAIWSRCCALHRHPTRHLQRQRRCGLLEGCCRQCRCRGRGWDVGNEISHLDLLRRATLRTNSMWSTPQRRCMAEGVSTGCGTVSVLIQEDCTLLDRIWSNVN
jgi:hypothetical protein